MRRRLSDLPFVEFLGVAQRESGHELAAIERRGRPERPEAVATQVVAGMLVTASDGERLLETPEIDVEGGGVQADGRAVDDQAPAAQARLQDRERPAQGAPRIGPVGLRPEQGRDMIAAGRPAGHREIGKECDRLARIDGEGRAVDLRGHGAEQADPDPGIWHQSSRYPKRDGSRNDLRTVRGDDALMNVPQTTRGWS